MMSLQFHSMLGSANYLRANTRVHPNTKKLLDYKHFYLPQPTAFGTLMINTTIESIISNMCRLCGVPHFIDHGDIVAEIYRHYTLMFCGLHLANVSMVITTNRVMFGWNDDPNCMFFHTVRVDKYNVGLGMNIDDTIIYRLDVGCDPKKKGCLPTCIQLGVLCGKDTPWPSILFDVDDYDDNFRYNDILEMYQTKKINECMNDLKLTNLLDVSTFAYRFNQLNKQTTCYTYLSCNYTKDKTFIDDSGFIINIPCSDGPKLSGTFDVYITKLESIGDIEIGFGHNGKKQNSPGGSIYKSVAGNQQYWIFMVCKGIEGHCAYRTGVWVHKSKNDFTHEIW